MPYCEHTPYKRFDSEQEKFNAGYNEFINSEDPWKYDFKENGEGYVATTEYEQSILSQLVFINLVNSFKTDIEADISKLEPGLSIQVKDTKKEIEKYFLFDIMHNPGEGCQPGRQANRDECNYGELSFKEIYHTIGNFAPVPRTIISNYYGPNLQQIHLHLNELWPWFLKFLKDNWDEFPTEVSEIMTFEEYMKYTCQQMYFSNVFESVYQMYNDNSNNCWEEIFKKLSDTEISKNDTLISFNALLKSGDKRDIEEIDKKIMFLIEVRGRYIIYLLKDKNSN